MKKIAILGPKNTYSDLCYHKFMSLSGLELTPYYYHSIQQVVKEGSLLDFVILPFENTLEGYVQPHMDLLMESGLCIDCELSLPIDFKYVSKKHTTPLNLYVQYVTKNQCLNFIESHSNLNLVITDSNVESYHRFKEDPYGAAIVPNHIDTSEYDRKQNVSDRILNHTRFLILKSKPIYLTKYQLKDTFKVSLVITPSEDKPGLLYEILKGFSNYDLNLISIMSRPTKELLGNYHFFIDLEVKQDHYQEVLTVIEALSERFVVNVLGVYQVIKKNPA
ncbi:MAG: prephenate dehydratase domain-containing protein [Acholeplasma sp.]|nr:prephenate dehydratase domain-containing protein [Acholeplasma sp.]